MLDLILENPDLRIHMGDLGQRFVSDTYSWNAVGERLFAALHAGGCPS